MNYIVKYYFKLILSYTRKRYKRPKVSAHTTDIRNIAVIFSIPKNSPRLTTWNDGFVAAMGHLEQDYKITWINIETEVLTENYLNGFDFLLVKSNWNWGPDKLLRGKYRNLTVKKGLAVAGVSIPPKYSEMLYYDVLWYETDWYKRIIQNHPNIHHAFGINKRDLKPGSGTIKYEYISIGAFLPHKRMHLIRNLKGKVLVIGEKYNTPYSVSIENSLKNCENVDVMPFVEYAKLGEYMSLAKTLYIPATVNGGGERAILEARHFGLQIEIERDNKKLEEIKNSEIWDSEYYASQLLKGIISV